MQRPSEPPLQALHKDALRLPPNLHEIERVLRERAEVSPSRTDRSGAGDEQSIDCRAAPAEERVNDASSDAKVGSESRATDSGGPLLERPLSRKHVRQKPRREGTVFDRLRDPFAGHRVDAGSL